MLVASDFSDDITTIGGTMIQYCQTPDDPAYIAAPDNDKQEHGVKPLDRLPAQWWNWFLNQATRRFGEYEKYVQNALSELNNILSITGEAPSSSTEVTDQLQTLFQSTYLQSYLPKVINSANDFAVDPTVDSKLFVTNDDGNGTHTVSTVPYAPPFVENTQIISAAKNVNLPSNSPHEGQIIKVVFRNGHVASSNSDYMTLDVNSSGMPAPIAVNQNGTLVNLPIHELTAGAYSVLQSNTVLDMYYTENGLSSNPTWVVVGNPVVLSSANYTIYADGLKRVDSVQSGEMGMVTGNAVYNHCEALVPKSLIPVTPSSVGTNSGQGAYTATHTLELVQYSFALCRLAIKMNNATVYEIEAPLGNQYYPVSITYTSPAFILPKGKTIVATATPNLTPQDVYCWRITQPILL